MSTSAAARRFNYLFFSLPNVVCSVQDQQTVEELCNNTTHELIYLYLFLLPPKARGFYVIAFHNIKVLIRLTVYPISTSGTP